MPQDLAPLSDCPRVYIIDDEWSIAESLAALLAKNGFHSQAFHNPGQVLVRAMDQPPDVLIADVMMPGMSGVELAVALRRAGLRCRIVLFSGQAGAVDMLSDARRQGFPFELLEKPIDPRELLQHLRQIQPEEIPPAPSAQKQPPSEALTVAIRAA